MKSIAAILLLAMSSIVHAEDDSGKTKLLRISPEKAADIVRKTPAKDKARVERFCQMAKEGQAKITLVGPGEEEAVAATECDYQDCNGHQCISYNPDTGMGYCSDCCVAAMGAASKQFSTHIPKRKHGPIIAYVSGAKGTARVVRRYRAAAAAALGAQTVGDSEWIIPRDKKPERFKVTLEGGPTLKDDDDPKAGDTRVSRNCKCKGNFPAQDSGCQSADVGSYRVVRLGHSTCESSKDSSCPETYTDVIYRYSYSDNQCQNETARRALVQDWVCLP